MATETNPSFDAPPTGTLDRIARIAIETLLLACVTLSPWAFGAVEPWSLALIQAVAGTILILWSLRILLGGKSSIPGKAPRVLALLFFGLIVLQMIPLPAFAGRFLAPEGTDVRAALLPAGSVSDENPSSLAPLSTGWERGFQGLLTYSSFAVLFLAALAHLQSQKSLRRLLLVVMGTGFALSVFGIAQKLTSEARIYWTVDLTRGGTPFGPYVNRNHFAGFVEMAALVSLGILAFRIRKWSRDRGGVPFRVSSFLSDPGGAGIVFTGLMATVMITAVFLSLSRGGMVALALGCAVFCFGLLRRPRVILGIATFFVAAASLLAWLGGEELVARMAALDQLQLRMDLWRSCLALILAFPVFGVGLGNFAEVLPAFQDFPADKTFRYAESDWWHFGAELGFVGLLLIAACALTLAFHLGRGLSASRRSRPLLLGIVAALIAIAAHGFVDFNLHIPANAVLFLLLVAVGWNLSRRALSQPSAVPSSCSTPS